jgi:hypothetical protein
MRRIVSFLSWSISLVVLIFLAGGSVQRSSADTTNPVFNNALAYWSMDDTGTTITDAIGTANSNATNTASSPGKINGARGFNGTSAYIDFSNSANYTGNSFSIGAWAKLTDNRIRHTIVHKNFQYSLVVDGSNGKVSYADSSVWDYNSFGWWGSVSLNAWHYIVAVRSGTNVTIYVDGVQIVSKTFGSAIGSTPNPLFVGCYATTTCVSPYYLKGTVDEVGLWSRALTSSDVLTLYNGGNGLAYNGPALPPDPTIEQNFPVSVTCQTRRGQICNPVFTTSVETGNILRAEYIPPATHCASVRIHFWIDGVYSRTSSYLASTGMPDLPASTGLQDFRPVTAGTHTVGIQAEGQNGGCDTGYLGGWGGTLKVVRSDAVAAPAAQQPILIVTNPLAPNKYSRNLAEIVKAEGLVGYQQTELAQVTRTTSPLAYLQQYQLVILGETALTASEEQMFRDYVAGGGKLIAMRPDSGLADVFGLHFIGTRAENVQQFFAVDTSSSPGNGIASQSLQYHGAADNYTLGNAVMLASLWNTIATPSSNPAVTLNNYGSGKAVAFTFDLAKSIALMRQGNPAWANTEGDNLAGYRPADMFTRTDGTLWVAPQRIKIPQADEQQHFLANIVQYLLPAPQPRLWFLPGTNKQVLITTNDGEENGGNDFTPILNAITSYGGRMSIYLREAGVTNTTAATEAGWRSAGHETGPHMGGYSTGDNYETQYPAYQSLTDGILSKFGHASRTARNHTIDWTGWIDTAKIESRFGTSLDTNYYHYIPSLLQYAGNENGYFTGSGLAQKLIDENGNPLSMYQILTEWPDEWFADKNFGATNAANIVKSMMTAAQNGYYSAFVANVHTVRYNNPADPTNSWANQVWAHAQANGVPMITAEKYLDFLQARNASQFTATAWTGTTLSFDFSTPAGGQQLTLMVPRQANGKVLSDITVNGITTAYTTDTIKGVSYALFTTTATSSRVVATYF